MHAPLRQRTHARRTWRAMICPRPCGRVEIPSSPWCMITKSSSLHECRSYQARPTAFMPEHDSVLVSCWHQATPGLGILRHMVLVSLQSWCLAGTRRHMTLPVLTPNAQSCRTFITTLSILSTASTGKGWRARAHSQKSKWKRLQFTGALIPSIPLYTSALIPSIPVL